MVSRRVNSELMSSRNELDESDSPRRQHRKMKNLFSRFFLSKRSRDNASAIEIGRVMGPFKSSVILPLIRARGCAAHFQYLIRLMPRQRASCTSSV